MRYKKLFCLCLLALCAALLTGCQPYADTPVISPPAATDVPETEVTPEGVVPAFFPAQLQGLTSAEMRYTPLPAQGLEGTYIQTVTDATVLLQIEHLLAAAQPSAPSECAFGYATLVLTTDAGVTITLDMAADSCLQFRAEGEYYNYRPAGSSSENSITNAILYDFFADIPFSHK